MSWGIPVSIRVLRGCLMSIFVLGAIALCGPSATAQPHTADQNGNNSIELAELLRVIQFFNVGALSCDPQQASEDGYLAGPGDESCTPHDSDYSAQDWMINLTELLRLIQFFNLGGYAVCPDEGTEDGFCTVIAEPDPLALYVDVYEDAVPYSSQLLLTVHAVNQSNEPIENLELTMPIPSGLLDRSDSNILFASCPFGDCDPGETLTWSLGTLPPGEARMINYRSRILENGSIAVGDTVTFAVDATADGNLSASAQASLARSETARLTVGIAPDNREVPAGNTLSFTVSYGNGLDTQLQTGEVTARIPSNTTFVGATGDGQLVDGKVTWDASGLRAGDARQQRFTVLIDGGVVPLTPILSNAAFTGTSIDGDFEAGSLARSFVVPEAPFRVDVDAHRTLVRPGQAVTYAVTVTNLTDTTQQDLRLWMAAPNHFKEFNEPQDASCPFDDCSSYENIFWEVTLPANSSRTFTFRAYGLDAITPGQIGFAECFVWDSTTGYSASTQVDTIFTDLGTLEAVMSAESRKTVPRAMKDFTVHFSNRLGEALSAGTLTAWLPPGATFVDATGEATLEDGKLNWDVAGLANGEARVERFTVEMGADAELGEALAAEVELNGTALFGPASTWSRTRLTVNPDPVIRVHVDTSESVLKPNDNVAFTVTVSNLSTTPLNDVTAYIRMLPWLAEFAEPVLGNCPFDDCNEGELLTLSLDTLNAGETRTLVFRGFVRSDAATGATSHSSALVRTAGGFEAGTEIAYAINQQQSVRAHITPDRVHVEPGDEVSYSITYGNGLGSGTVTAWLPPGTTFLDATGNPSFDGRTLTWNTPPMTMGRSFNERATVLVSGDAALGETLAAEVHYVGENDFGGLVSNWSRTRASVIPTPGISLDLDTTETIVAPGMQVLYTLTATNRTALPVNNVSIFMDFAYFVTEFNEVLDESCSFDDCGAGERGSFSISTLRPMESRTFAIYPYTRSDLRVDAPLLRASAWMFDESGRIAYDEAAMRGNTVGEFRLSLTPDVYQVSADEEVAVTLNYSNQLGESTTGGTAVVWLPPDVTFVSATGGGVEVDGLITWAVPNLAPGEGGQETFVFRTPAGAATGDELPIEVEAVVPAQFLTISETARARVVIGNTNGLELEVTAEPGVVSPGDTLTYTFTVTNNTGNIVNNVDLDAQMPSWVARLSGEPDGAICTFDTCDAAEPISWSLGTLGPGQSVSRVITPVVRSSSNVPPAGTIIFNRARVTGDGNLYDLETTTVLVD